ncbi:MAG TPA: ABC transporter ATP-binding protein [Acidimicrobiales bacterium]|nr:ABC transporter ATP-binding protein [Acidimicrobiales bacterium]
MSRTIGTVPTRRAATARGWWRGSEPPPAPARGDLVCRGIGVRVGERALVEDVSFTVPVGGWLTVVGPNGAGKTSLLRAVAGLAAHQGSASVGDAALETLHPAARARLVAFVPQHPVVPPGLRVFDYVLLGRTAHLRPLGAEGAHDLAVARRVLAALGLDGYAERLLSSLSGGERQRAVIGRALAQESPVLLLDEPTSGLDIAYQQDVLDLVNRLRREERLSVLSTMHDLTLAGAYADQLALLAEGRVVAIGPPSETLTEANLARITRARIRLLREGDTTVVVHLPPVAGAP